MTETKLTAEGHLDITQFQLNWQPSPLRSEDAFLKISTPQYYTLVGLPDKYDFRDLMSPIKNQGLTGACTAFAASGAMEYLLKINDKLNVPLSELFLYYVTRRNVMNIPAERDIGAHFSATIDATKIYGVCSNHSMPYGKPDGSVDVTEVPSDAAYLEAQTRKVVEAARVLESTNKFQVLEDIKTVLSRQIPVLLGFTCYSSIRDIAVTKTGRIPEPGNGYKIGGHAVCLCGYSDADQMLHFKNSWSKHWGEDGYGYLPYSYILNGEAADFWTILSAVVIVNTIAIPISMKSGTIKKATMQIQEEEPDLPQESKRATREEETKDVKVTVKPRQQVVRAVVCRCETENIPCPCQCCVIKRQKLNAPSIYICVCVLKSSTSDTFTQCKCSCCAEQREIQRSIHLPEVKIVVKPEPPDIETPVIPLEAKETKAESPQKAETKQEPMHPIERPETKQEPLHPIEKPEAKVEPVPFIEKPEIKGEPVAKPCQCLMDIPFSSNLQMKCTCQCCVIMNGAFEFPLSYHCHCKVKVPFISKYILCQCECCHKLRKQDSRADDIIVVNPEEDRGQPIIGGMKWQRTPADRRVLDALLIIDRSSEKEISIQISDPRWHVPVRKI